MFGEGISMLDLVALLNAIRAKKLVLQVKINDAPWENLSADVIKNMTIAVTNGCITQSNRIRLQLFEKQEHSTE